MFSKVWDSVWGLYLTIWRNSCGNFHANSIRTRLKRSPDPKNHRFICIFLDFWRSAAEAAACKLKWGCAFGLMRISLTWQDILVNSWPNKIMTDCISTPAQFSLQASASHILLLQFLMPHSTRPLVHNLRIQLGHQHGRQIPEWWRCPYAQADKRGFAEHGNDMNKHNHTYSEDMTSGSGRP